MRLKDAKDELYKLKDEVSTQEREYRKLIEERDKLKERVKKLIAKKGNISTQTKTCKNCTREFTEKENYNWSCRTHRSEWSGEMWWCCGKYSKDALGCKFQKHQARNDDDDDLHTEGIKESN